MVSSSTWILSLKVLFISVGVVSLATFLKCSVPLILDEAPTIWSTVVSWLKPPYLYVIINGIIITIAASSRFGHKLDDEHTQSEPSVPSRPLQSDLPSDLVAVSAQPEFGDVEERQMVVYESEEKVLEVVNGSEVVADDDDEDLFVLSRSSWTPSHRKIPQEIETELLSRATEKPLVSARFGHRKPVKSSPEGVRALRVAKPKRHETLENTWKTITDGRHMPLTRHLKRSDTWENHGHDVNVDHTADHMMKSETFKDRTNNDPVSSLSPSPSLGKVRKEPSLGQDELNRRVEAFIKKFNDEMRLQRQESLNQYMEMINRGAH